MAISGHFLINFSGTAAAFSEEFWGSFRAISEQFRGNCLSLFFLNNFGIVRDSYNKDNEVGGIHGNVARRTPHAARPNKFGSFRL